MKDRNLANLYIGRATRALRDRELSPFFSGKDPRPTALSPQGDQ